MSQTFGDDYKARKDAQVFDGVLMYFPDAVAAVAAVSVQGNKQHNPGEKLHWAREKSTDQMNTALRHMMDHGVGERFDSDGTRHLAKTAWRVLAALQLDIEAERAQAKPEWDRTQCGCGTYTFLAGSRWVPGFRLPTMPTIHGIGKCIDV
jgi:hypothetical protein